MFSAILCIVLAVVVLFAGVLLVGPPYVPTLGKQADTALDLLNLQPGQLLLELGAGDGKVVSRAAAKGLRVVGIELNPLLVVVARLRTVRYGKQVRIVWGGLLAHGMACRR